MTTDTGSSGRIANGTSKTGHGRIQTDVRLYGARASYQLPAALSILRDSPVIHVAFVHPGDGAGREETIMNLPLLAVVIPDVEVEGEYDEDDERYWAMYLHTHRQSGLVEAVESGIKSLTATTTKIDGMVFSPTPHDHSLDYRSATFHLHSPSVLDEATPAQYEEKRAALSEVLDAVTGYDRTRLVGPATGPNVERTTVVKLKIKAVSCKQRYGAFNGGKEPELDTPEGKEADAFTGVVPCWTQWGVPIGYGHDRADLTAHFEKRSREGKAFANGVVWASEAASLEGLGKKRKPKVDDE